MLNNLMSEFVHVIYNLVLKDRGVLENVDINGTGYSYFSKRSLYNQTV